MLYAFFSVCEFIIYLSVLTYCYVLSRDLHVGTKRTCDVCDVKTLKEEGLVPLPHTRRSSL